LIAETPASWKQVTSHGIDEITEAAQSLVCRLQSSDVFLLLIIVYLYDLEENPVACATLKPVVNEEEVAKYEALFEQLN